MPDLLLELFSEEIPARMQAGAARDLERLVVGALSDRGLLFEGIKAFAGPRRLTLGGERFARQAGRCARGNQRPQDRCARSRDRRLSEKDRPEQRPAQDREDGQGRCLYRRDRTRRPRDGRGAGGNPARSDRQAALAQIHALEAGREYALGAAAAFHSLHLRRRSGAVRLRRRFQRPPHQGPSLPGAGEDRGPALRGLCRGPQESAMWCWTRTSAPPSSSKASSRRPLSMAWN